MTEKEREKIIEFIKENDNTYNYTSVNFKFYSDKDLIVLKKNIEIRMINSKGDDGAILRADDSIIPQGDDDAIQPYAIS